MGLQVSCFGGRQSFMKHIFGRSGEVRRFVEPHGACCGGPCCERYSMYGRMRTYYTGEVERQYWTRVHIIRYYSRDFFFVIPLLFTMNGPTISMS